MAEAGTPSPTAGTEMTDGEADVATANATAGDTSVTPNDRLKEIAFTATIGMLDSLVGMLGPDSTHGVRAADICNELMQLKTAATGTPVTAHGSFPSAKTGSDRARLDRKSSELDRKSSELPAVKPLSPLRPIKSNLGEATASANASAAIGVMGSSPLQRSRSDKLRNKDSVFNGKMTGAKVSSIEQNFKLGELQTRHSEKKGLAGKGGYKPQMSSFSADGRRRSQAIMPETLMNSTFSINAAYKGEVSEEEAEGGEGADKSPASDALTRVRRVSRAVAFSQSMTTLGSMSEQDFEARTERCLLAARAHDIFRLLDADGSGTLGPEEIRNGLSQLGFDKKGRAGIDKLVKQADADGSGEIDINEFVDMISDAMNNGEMKESQMDLVEMMHDLLHEDEERRKNMVEGDSSCMLNPRELTSHTWDLAVAVILIFTVLSNPLSMAFEPVSERLFYFNVVSDLIFCVDILKHFNTGYLNDAGFAVMDRWKVTKAYLLSWFLPDLIASIPIDLFLIGGSGSALRASKILKLLKLFRITKIIRLFRLSRLSHYFYEMRTAFEDYFKVQIPEGSVSIVYLFLYLLLLVHWTGCLNFMIARIYEFPEGCWVEVAGLVDARVSRQYAWCFFKGLAQMIGLGFEIPPVVNTSCIDTQFWCTMEHWTSLVCLYIGVTFYALLISNFEVIVQNANHSRINLREKLQTANDYMKAKHIPSHIREKVRNYFKIQFQEKGLSGKTFDEAAILQDLTPNLREEITLYNQRHLIELVPLLKRAPPVFSSRCALALSTRVNLEGEFVFEEDSHGDDLYFISSGVCEVVSQHLPPDEQVVKILAAGYYFGDVACLFQVPRTAGVRAKVSTMLFTITRDKMMLILDDHPNMREYMTLVARRRQVRLEALNPSKVVGQLAQDNIGKDVEDSRTDYFSKFSRMQIQEDLAIDHEKSMARQSKRRKYSWVT